jgi:hypothetical protein
MVVLLAAMVGPAHFPKQAVAMLKYLSLIAGVSGSLMSSVAHAQYDTAYQFDAHTGWSIFDPASIGVAAVIVVLERFPFRLPIS